MSNIFAKSRDHKLQKKIEHGTPDILIDTGISTLAVIHHDDFDIIFQQNCRNLGLLVYGKFSLYYILNQGELGVYISKRTAIEHSVCGRECSAAEAADGAPNTLMVSKYNDEILSMVSFHKNVLAIIVVRDLLRILILREKISTNKWGFIIGGYLFQWSWF